MLFSTRATNCVSGSAFADGREAGRVWLCGATLLRAAVHAAQQRQRIDAQDHADHHDGDQPEAALEQAAADRNAAAAEAAAAEPATAESTAFAAAILDVAALIAIHLHGSVSIG